eukprot:6193390-Pleurochrysis_carterae.AAC.2
MKPPPSRTVDRPGCSTAQQQNQHSCVTARIETMRSILGGGSPPNRKAACSRTKEEDTIIVVQGGHPRKVYAARFKGARICGHRCVLYCVLCCGGDALPGRRATGCRPDGGGGQRLWSSGAQQLAPRTFGTTSFSVV